MIIGGSESRKTNARWNLISQQDDTEKTCFYAKYLREPKFEFFIKKREDAGMI